MLADLHRDRPVGAAVLLADDHVLRHVHQTTGQVTRVGGTQRGVGQTLAGTVRGDEVLQHGQALAVAGLDRPRDDLALRVGHQTTDRRDLAELEQVTAGTRVDHLPQRVLLRQRRLHLLGDLVGRLGPDLDELAATLLGGHQTALVLLVDPVGFLLVPLQDLPLARRRDDVLHADRHAGPGGPVETGLLERVQRRGQRHLREPLGEVVDDRRELTLADLVVDEPVALRQGLVEQHPAQRGLHGQRLARRPALRARPTARAPAPLSTSTTPCSRILHRRLQVQLAVVERHPRLGVGAERPALALARPGAGGSGGTGR